MHGADYKPSGERYIICTVMETLYFLKLNWLAEIEPFTF